MATWHNALQQILTSTHGKEKGSALAAKYQHAFVSGYMEEYSEAIACNDIGHIELLSPDHPIEIFFYKAADESLHLRIFKWERAIPLSDILPMLENFGLRTQSERPHKILIGNGNEAWISDFAVEYVNAQLDIMKAEELFEDAFIQIYRGNAENDGFNRLILASLLSWREILILRTYAKYLRQVGFLLSQPAIEKALVNNGELSRMLIALFDALLNPEIKEERQAQAATMENNIIEALNAVKSLDEDRAIRKILELMNATLRTNYYQRNSNKKPKDYLALKINSRVITDMPLPIPLYEIFIYSPYFEGIHLRNTKVARGGIRWSDRHEDFRTEILGLMKAQTVKNAVIVPSGAKGGFVLKNTMPFPTREALQQEVIKCYKIFISGLLDLTDNIENKEIIRPVDVVCHDDTDPYLVVAADKGTASFSDIANGLSHDHHFWLDDAFASGGSTGYDHKKMAITARGAWESIKRHFRELGVNAVSHEITMVGIGDMSGDVFGNGLLYSRHLKLIAAFDHRHIFIDPNPEPLKAYEERARLFNLPASSWKDYNPDLISQGGGVFDRSLKSIALTPEMQAALGTTATALAPLELIRTILRAPVELLYNGGIGTYVKGSTEINADVGDKTNDYCRVNGNELRCKVVGEGGNLGFTQKGRVDFALNGGLINTDFIDNSAGVDCSDHEVNLKILLAPEVAANRLTFEDRNQLLASITDEVAALVLKDNHDQALLMSLSAFSADRYIGLHMNYIAELESLGIIDRAVDGLPNEKELIERKTAGIGLTRPELAVLLAQTKIHLKQEILQTDLTEDETLCQLAKTAFPPKIRENYQAAIKEHSLKRDIIATQLSNLIVNEMGITFVYRMQIETGASVNDIIRAQTIAVHIFDTRELQELVHSLNHAITISEQYEMLSHIRNLINLATRWFLHSNLLKQGLQETIAQYRPHIKTLSSIIPDLMSGSTKDYLLNLQEKFISLGLTQEHANRIATFRAIYTSLNIIEVSTKNNFDLAQTAEAYFVGGERMNLVWIRDQLANDNRDGHLNTLARLTLRDELDIAQRAITVAVLSKAKNEKDIHVIFDKWTKRNQHIINRWERLLAMLTSSTTFEYTMFFIAIRELIGLILASQ